MSNKTVLLLSEDLELAKQFSEFAFFNKVDAAADYKKFNKKTVEKYDIVVISQKVFPVDTFNEVFGDVFSGVEHMFYISESPETFEQTKATLSGKKVYCIPFGKTPKQALDLVCKNSGMSIFERDNLFVFMGADSKVGTSMVSLSIAERLSIRTDARILYLDLGALSKNCYIPKEAAKNNIDVIRSKFVNNILTNTELQESCFKKEKLHILNGVLDIKNSRLYQPEDIEKLLQNACETFDIIIVDAGCNLLLDLGLSIGAINFANTVHLVTTQQENSKKNYIRMKEQVFDRLGMESGKFQLLINKYMQNDDLPSAQDIGHEYQLKVKETISNSDYGWAAEKANNTLLNYQNDKYNKDIDKIVKGVIKQLSIKEKEIEKQGILDRIKGFVKK